ncbi:phage major capsid family protein [Gordonibacter massiliensis (ex Traore et al. 2017)]|uniref:phage major capsid family protein n=1 Tax=Gordonibacter massiliensis (ex Traore et al. 2017) TaxID=1841863 RepID=UPI001C8BF041|nr:hypothetical protein [Gordonibacter massiliensis (ex Traore et al. 2017)]MBX9032666.1 phage major capsid protein [Gordonibacter massiliensis (ex Traore et al. 2017)]
MAIKLNNSTIGTVMAAAMQSGDQAQIEQAWEQFHAQLAEQIVQDFEDVKASNDSTILAQRGYRQLTNKEMRYYKNLAEALKSDNPQQKFTEIIGSDEEDALMPDTTIESVFNDLKEDHELLSKMSFTYVKYAVKWILSDHTKQKAVWGKITDAITKEITSGFRVIDIHQSKLSAYAFIERGMLDLGPVFLDGYIRTVLMEALYCGLEAGGIAGTGVEEPIGMDRDIHEGVSFSTTDGYPRKNKETVTDFTPATYGALLGKIAKTEKGALRKFSKVQMIVNMSDYLTKIMPATTALNTAGKYVNDLFPFPTEVIVSNELGDGEALLGLLEEYNMFLGGDRNGQIDFSDDFKFLEDTRYFKVIQYGTGRAFDNTSFLLLDISNLDPAYITVKVGGAVDVNGANDAPTV